MKRLRYLVILLLAAIVTGGVFYFMQSLIAGDPGAAQAAALPPAIHFGPVDLPDPVAPKPPRKPPDPPKPPPPPENLVVTDPIQEPDRRIGPVLPPGPGEGIHSGGRDYPPPVYRSEDDAVPIVSPPLRYPQQAVIKNIEGWVKVEFIITPAGTVRTPRVFESSPPGVFDKEAVRAILKWRFKPQIVDGQPIERRATQIFDFKPDADA